MLRIFVHSDIFLFKRIFFSGTSYVSRIQLIMFSCIASFIGSSYLPRIAVKIWFNHGLAWTVSKELRGNIYVFLMG